MSYWYMYMLPDLLTISCRMNGADAAIHIGVTPANVRGGYDSKSNKMLI